MEPVEPQDQRILHILPIESRLPIIDKNTLTSKIHFRIEKVSRRKDGRKFRLQIQIEGSNDGCSVFSDPILVLSKHRTDTTTTTTTTTTNLLSSSSAITPPITLTNNNPPPPPPIVDNTEMTKLIDMCTEILTRQNKTEQSLLILINRLENIERNIFQLRIPQFDLTQPSQKFDYLLPQQQQQQLNHNPSLPESPHNQQQQQHFSSSSSSSPLPPVPQVNITSASAGEMNGIKRSISSQMFIPRLMSYGYAGLDVPSYIPDIQENPNKIRRLLSSDIEFTLECKGNGNNGERSDENNQKS